MLKRCSICGVDKEIDMFYKNRNSRDGYATECKECVKKRSKEWYKNNRKRVLAKCYEYRNSHKKQIEEYRGKIENKERARARKQTIHYKEYAKAYRQRYRERPEVKVKEKAYKQSEKYKTYCREYRKRMGVKARGKILYEEKMRNDPVYALKVRTRNLIKESIRKGGYEKGSKTQAIVGCSFENLWRHLLATWEKNYGKPWDGEPYHIDHITPLAIAKSEEDIIRLCYYTNLQMLTPGDNLKKGKRLDFYPSIVQYG